MSVIFFITFLMTTILISQFPKMAPYLSLMDWPNERSSHRVATPRGAGIIFVIVWMITGGGYLTYLGLWDLKFLNCFVCSGALALLGFWDDRYSLSAKWRFACQCIVMLIFLFSYKDFFLKEEWGEILLFITLFASLWSINLFNFMDGMDGLAGTEAIIILGSLGILSGGIMGFLTLNLCAALLGFLVFNFPKAKVFMGDGGSGFLGFMIAAWSLEGFVNYNIPLWIPLLCYSMFWVDATFTLLKRIIKREPWYKPHKQHAYQKLHHKAHWSHKKVLFMVSIINIILVGIVFGMSNNWLPLYLGVVLSLGLVLGYLFFSEIISREKQ